MTRPDFTPMRCVQHDAGQVFWRGVDVPCFVCGRPGVEAGRTFPTAVAGHSWRPPDGPVPVRL